jgi:hypothetical protein
MWRVLLALFFHRLLLFIVALITINNNMVHQPTNGKSFRIENTSVLIHQFLNKIHETPEAVAMAKLSQLPLSQVFRETKQPFLWICRLLVGGAHLPISVSLILLSNVFLFFFLWELFTLINRMATPETSVTAVILVLLWPTSYELSLGSALSLTCCLATLVVRHALDNEWFIGGIGLGILALVDPLAAGLLPLLLFLFWYFQRHLPAKEMVQKFLFFIVPVGLAIAWRHTTYAHLNDWVEGSALLAVFRSRGHATLDWSFSSGLAGQTVAALFFITGAVAAAVSNASLIHRIIPVYLLILMMLFSPYAAIASRASVAGVCLQGIATISAKPALRVIQILLLTLSIFEVTAIFG